MKDMNEQWKPVNNFPYYLISNIGRVKNIKGKRTNILKPSISSGGYPKVTLCSMGKRHYMLIHRLVMEAFVSDVPAGLQVNHKNGIKADNRVENLEYCTNHENMKHACDTGLHAPMISVNQFSLDGELVKTFESKYEAERNGFNRGGVWACCKGNIKTYKGFKWQYAL